MCMRCLEITRRSMLVGGAAGGDASCERSPGAAPAAGHGSAGRARIPAYEKDEIGIWQLMERAEEEIAGSNLLIQDPKLTGYLKNLIGTVGGPAAKDFRIYLARIPDFNAMMFPSGFAVIFSGLLLRMRNEAQLAGVIAHEAGHFLRRHQIRAWRTRGGRLTSSPSGPCWPASAVRVRASTLAITCSLPSSARCLTLLKYSRDMEAEADAMGVKLLADNGLAPIEMANIWDQLIREETASASYRAKRRRRGSLFDTPVVGRPDEGPPPGR